MSVTETEESTDTSFQTPTGEEELAEQGELEEPVPEPDIGGSPELVGPVTRSGKKRKNFSAVRSTGKKKGKMIPKSPKQDAPSMSSGGRPGAGTTTGATARTSRSQRPYSRKRPRRRLFRNAMRRGTLGPPATPTTSPPCWQTSRPISRSP